MDRGQSPKLHTCAECIWCDQCAMPQICKHFSPADDSAEIYYEQDLRMRVEDYKTVLEEYHDGNEGVATAKAKSPKR